MSRVSSVLHAPPGPAHTYGAAGNSGDLPTAFLKNRWTLAANAAGSGNRGSSVRRLRCRLGRAIYSVRIVGVFSSGRGDGHPQTKHPEHPPHPNPIEQTGPGVANARAGVKEDRATIPVASCRMATRLNYTSAGDGNTVADSTVVDCVTGSTSAPVCKATMPSIPELCLRPGQPRPADSVPGAGRLRWQSAC